MIESTWNRIVDHILSPAVWLLFSLALLLFLWGLVQFLLKSDTDEGRKTGGKHMLWGIVGMFIMIAANAIVAIIENTLRL